MLYSSYTYLFFFLPVVVFFFHVIARRLGPRPALVWLLASSLLFYAWWDWRFLPLLLFSIVFNLAVGRRLAGLRSRGLLVLGLAVNLLLLGAFKYTDFVISILNSVGFNLQTLGLVLPIGISFFTFQQISFLVESYRHGGEDYDPLRYSLFVSLFCQLVSGPIVYQKDLTPQFTAARTFRLDWNNIASGLFLISLGMAKKTLADVFVDWSYVPGGVGPETTFIGAWLTGLCYAMRIYFDFSAYIDMARGSAQLINLDIPINFDSPYKATSIRDFWRRWNITLSVFLRDYVYFPLGGSRLTRSRTLVNLFTTMLLAGLWHGAGWGFIFWGAVHGLFTCFNHALRWTGVRIPVLLGRVATFLGVVLAWAFFKSPTLKEAVGVAKAMLGGNGLHLVMPQGLLAWAKANGLAAGLDRFGVHLIHHSQVAGYFGKWSLVMLAVALGICWFAPNSNQLTEDFRPTAFKVVYASVLFSVSVLFLSYVRDFVYFQF